MFYNFLLHQKLIFAFEIRLKHTSKCRLRFRNSRFLCIKLNLFRNLGSSRKWDEFSKLGRSAQTPSWISEFKLDSNSLQLWILKRNFTKYGWIFKKMTFSFSRNHVLISKLKIFYLYIDLNSLQNTQILILPKIRL